MNAVATEQKCGVGSERTSPKRICFVVSHPIQYTVPLYQRLARRDGVAIKVFFTWHAGGKAVEDRGFGRAIAWDIPLTEGYEFELVPNVAAALGTDRFFGLRNPALLDRVMTWRPDVVHVTGWAWFSHLQLLRSLHRRGVPAVFFGDSHLLDGKTHGPRWWIKSAALRKIYSWPTACLFAGSANRAYFEAFGVPPERLYPCPHSIDVSRFAEPPAPKQDEAARWRAELGIAPDRKVLLYAGKFEPKKRPVELMRAVARLPDPSLLLVMVGAGALQAEVDAIAAGDPARFRVLPFQNQSRMPTVYRLGDIFVLPSGYGESWGLAVNEALACSRPIIVSDRVGCAADVVDASCGRIFAWNDWTAFGKAVEAMFGDPEKLADMRRAAGERAHRFDVGVTTTALVAAVESILQQIGRARRAAQGG
ncbi:MAG TPA: glycosyltransferase family 4 protein [Xanthobacteraceae bacterium]|nr:glycosyltransferase family 4 protein [Xanthobacteraceae bacterium]